MRVPFDMHLAHSEQVFLQYHTWRDRFSDTTWTECIAVDIWECERDIHRQHSKATTILRSIRRVSPEDAYRQYPAGLASSCAQRAVTTG